MKRIIIGILIALIPVMFVGVFILFSLDKCPDCNDNNKCTVDFCSKETEGVCQHEIILNCDGNSICEYGEYNVSLDCPSCDDNNHCTDDVINYENGQCYNYKITPCDGDGVCEKGEYGVSDDCPLCEEPPECQRVIFDYNTLGCSYEKVFPCCGNDVCEAHETFMECNNDCVPTIDEVKIVCNGNDACTLKYALRSNDIELCYALIQKSQANICITNVAVNKNDINLCDLSFTSEQYSDKYGVWTDQEFSSQKDIDACEQEVIIAHLDVEDCLKELYYPNTCIEKIAIRENNESLCNNMIEEPGFETTKESYILKCWNIITSDYPNCKYIEIGWIADDCIMEIAKKLDNKDICQQHSSPGECEKEINMLE